MSVGFFLEDVRVRVRLLRFFLEDVRVRWILFTGCPCPLDLFFRISKNVRARWIFFAYTDILKKPMSMSKSALSRDTVLH